MPKMFHVQKLAVILAVGRGFLMGDVPITLSSSI
ncbi:hypothetical protein T08_9446 [Trichinella sp. T8]|nr:hypothetical protein T08_9446 [Trichinella sp. T8]